MKVFGIVGLGIMGGSFAKAIRQNLSSESNPVQIFALDSNEVSLKNALEEKIIDRGFGVNEADKMLSLCDFVIICLYPSLTVNFFKNNKDFFKAGSIVTDISGVKNIYKGMEDFFADCSFDFIIGHPMAGGAKEGFACSNGDYFKNHNYILLPQTWNRAENLSVFRDFVTKLGFSKITETDIDTHDSRIGFTSQLCHVVASSMVLSAPDTEVTSFGGGSFEDLTRIAMINAPLWTELFLTNKEKLLPHIENLRNSLEQFEEMIKNEDAASLEKTLQKVRSLREQM